MDALEDIVRFSIGFLNLFENNRGLVACEKRQFWAEPTFGQTYSPLGVPNVSSSRPLVAIVPLGLSSDISLECLTGVVSLIKACGIVLTN